MGILEIGMVLAIVLTIVMITLTVIAIIYIVADSFTSLNRESNNIDNELYWENIRINLKGKVLV